FLSLAHSLPLASSYISSLPAFIREHHSPELTTRIPVFHHTYTIDYALVLEDEVWAVPAATETLLKAGDVLIQRGTFHAWDNRSNAVCRIAFILIDAEPLACSATGHDYFRPRW